MNTKQIGKKKDTVIKIDKSLNKFDDTVLSPEKLEKANNMLRTIGLPKVFTKRIRKSKTKV
jgi:hypothetical protein